MPLNERILRRILTLMIKQIRKNNPIHIRKSENSLTNEGVGISRRWVSSSGSCHFALLHAAQIKLTVEFETNGKIKVELLTCLRLAFQLVDRSLRKYAVGPL